MLRVLFGVCMRLFRNLRPFYATVNNKISGLTIININVYRHINDPDFHAYCA